VSDSAYLALFRTSLYRPSTIVHSNLLRVHTKTERRCSLLLFNHVESSGGLLLGSTLLRSACMLAFVSCRCTAAVVIYCASGYSIWRSAYAPRASCHRASNDGAVPMLQATACTRLCYQADSSPEWHCVILMREDQRGNAAMRKRRGHCAVR